MGLTYKRFTGLCRRLRPGLAGSHVDPLPEEILHQGLNSMADIRIR